MRISDWSSDVCSSDLVDRSVGLDEVIVAAEFGGAMHRRDDSRRHRRADPERIVDRDHPVADTRVARIAELDIGQVAGLDLEHREVGLGVAADDARSEEHTSELQSLMRISYAVFCLKKKTTHHKS